MVMKNENYKAPEKGFFSKMHQARRNNQYHDMLCNLLMFFCKGLIVFFFTIGTLKTLNPVFESKTYTIGTNWHSDSKFSFKEQEKQRW